jgi:hypothetical protein
MALLVTAIVCAKRLPFAKRVETSVVELDTHIAGRGWALNEGYEELQGMN